MLIIKTIAFTTNKKTKIKDDLNINLLIFPFCLLPIIDHATKAIIEKRKLKTLKAILAPSYK